MELTEENSKKLAPFLKKVIDAINEIPPELVEYTDRALNQQREDLNRAQGWIVPPPESKVVAAKGTIEILEAILKIRKVQDTKDNDLLKAMVHDNQVKNIMNPGFI